MSDLYHDGSRELQDRFDTRRLADRIEQRLVADRIGDEDKAFIESLDMFFLATSDEHNQPSCSYKGGEPGFVRVVDPRTIAFPTYDGNGMFLSMGNLAQNRRIGMLFIGVGQGLVETVINPLAATLYPDDKTHKLNVLHAWWPGGIIIGGLIQTQHARNDKKVPWLGDIPGLGKLFTGTFRYKEKKELVIFVTPHIISENEKSVPSNPEETMNRHYFK